MSKGMEISCGACGILGRHGDEGWRSCKKCQRHLCYSCGLDTDIWPNPLVCAIPISRWMETMPKNATVQPSPDNFFERLKTSFSKLGGATVAAFTYGCLAWILCVMIGFMVMLTKLAWGL